MRKIKFRGRTDDGTWVYGSHIETVFDPYSNPYHLITPHEKGNFEYIVVDPDTVGQFTGMKDRNGKEIYEGDIISYTIRSFQAKGNENTVAHNGKFVFANEVYWDEVYLGWFQRTINQSDKSKTFGFSLKVSTVEEVIGNKFDNPELLEQDV